MDDRFETGLQFTLDELLTNRYPVSQETQMILTNGKAELTCGTAHLIALLPANRQEQAVRQALTVTVTHEPSEQGVQESLAAVRSIVSR